MFITLYNFSKKKNSTGIPSGSGTTVTAVLKEPTDILNPVFRLQASNFTGNIFNYVSAILMGTTRYYRIVNSTMETNDIVLITCEEDICATWRSEVLASSQYVVRSSDTALYKWLAAYDRRLILDNSVPTLSEVNHVHQYIFDAFSTTDGYYCIGIYGDINATAQQGQSQPTVFKRGPVSYFYISPFMLDLLCSQLNTIRQAAADANPLQYFASCVYIPFPLDNLENKYDTYLGTLKVGIHNITNIEIMLRKYDPDDDFDMVQLAISERMELPCHRQAQTHELLYLNYSPYYSAHMFAGPFGDFEVPIDRLSPPNSLDNYSRYVIVQIYVDQPTGVARLELQTVTDIILIVDAKIGVDIPLAQITSESLSGMFSIASNVIGAVGSLVTGNAFGVAQNIGAAILTGYQNKIPTVQSKGSTGAMSSLKDTDIELLITMEHITPVDINRFGLPIMDRIDLSTVALGSLVICRDAHIEVTGYQPEIEYIDNILNTGLYLE